MYMTEYMELKQKAIENPTKENLKAFGDWFMRDGIRYWNGEYFNAEEYKLYPIENADGEIIGYEMEDM